MAHKRSIKRVVGYGCTLLAVVVLGKDTVLTILQGTADLLNR